MIPLEQRKLSVLQGCRNELGGVRTAEFHCTLKAVELNSRNISKKCESCVTGLLLKSLV